MNNTLALKYRPKTFEDVKGIDSIVDILENQLETNTTKGSYLFCGTSGGGKSTVAKIFAEELNGSKHNVTELNMSDKTGIDDIRAIIDEARKKPIGTKYRIFILDEVHQITSQSQNALLKILEETPPHVKFILCTTNPEKLLPTIQNRCQRFDFPKQSNEVIIDHLKEIIRLENVMNLPDELMSKWEKIKYTDESLEYIANKSNGSFRASISYLDKVLSLTHDITQESVENALGVVSDSVYANLIDYIFNEEREKIAEIVRSATTSGVNLRDFVVQALKYAIDECISMKCKWDEKEVYLDIIETLSGLNGDLALSNYTDEYVIAKLWLI